jgi:hypothetical protein
MRKLKVGYWPLSADLSAPGDRRRVAFWAAARGHEIVLDISKNVDVIIASEKSDFNSALFSRARAPVIFDLIDAYMCPLNEVEDFGRGLAKKITSQISGPIKPFSGHVKDFCTRVTAVVCSSQEQEEIIGGYNQNTHVILDSHEEFPLIEFSRRERTKLSESRIFWEGQPATIRGVKQISPILSRLEVTNPLAIDFVTDPKYFQFLGRYLQRDTKRLIQGDLNEFNNKVSFINWSVENVCNSALRSDIAMIPIDLSVPMQRLKPENRLLIMWRLGLPCLTSASPAYIRVSDKANVTSACVHSTDWLENFRRLIEDRHFASEEVLRGQSYIRENHNREVLLKKWDSVVEAALN